MPQAGALEPREERPGNTGRTGSVKKILIIRLSSIGDVVMASPLIGAFARTWPGARISWLIEETSRPVLEANPRLDEIIVWERFKWRKLFRQKRLFFLAGRIRSFTRELRSERFDIVVDAQGLLKSGIWAFLSGAPVRVGIGSREGSRFLMTRVVDRSGAGNEMSSQYLLCAKALDLDTGDFRMEMPLTPEAERFGEEFARSLGGPFAAFSPFTTRPQKHWIQDRWKELARQIRKEMGLDVVLLGGPGEAEPAARILPEGDPGSVSLAGKTNLQQAAAVIGKASLLIGVDTGLTHMGFALGTPTVALFGATRPYLSLGDLPGAVLYHPRECSPCRRSPTCDGLFPCMEAISVDEVLQTAGDLLRPK